MPGPPVQPATRQVCLALPDRQRLPSGLSLLIPGLHPHSLERGAMTLSESEYTQLASSELKQLLESLDELGDELEAELASDILTLEFPDGARYVINSHRAARQIWMAAETRAWHFSFDSSRERWIATKTGEELWQVVREQVSAKLNHPIVLTAARA